MSGLKIPYENLEKSNEVFFNEIYESTQNTIKKGWYILGTEVKAFESEFASYVGSSFCSGVASGLDALIIALRILNIPKGSEVIVPSNTYIATILSILQEGLTPVLVEPDIQTYNIDPQKIEAAITTKTKAIMVVHLYGKSCQMDEITRIAEKYHLPIIEDCAQSHGAKFKGKMTGSFGIGAFSFYPTKNLGAMGDAGAIVIHDSGLNDQIRMIRNYGSKIKYFNEVVGMNSRLDELQATVLRIKLRRLDEINLHKRKLAEIYFRELSGIKELILPVISPDFYDVYHIFNVRTERRDQLKDFLLSKGIGTEIHYPVAPHLQKAMAGKIEGRRFPISEEIHRTTLSLPISFGHNQGDVFQVTSAIKQFF